MQKPGLEKLWQLVGTLVHSQYISIAIQAYRAKPKGGFRIASTALALPILCLVASNRVAAQIKPDTTLPRNSIVTSRGNIIKIDGGTQAGSNLFHSFSQFSVPTGGTAFFNNAAGISNIFSRVTGGFVSNIDGILKANGTANLFLINPNGIIFGPNAKLNIGGSFAVTSANAIQFGNQGVFSASVPNDPSLLTVNPSAFLFNQIADQGTNSIENRGDLEVNPGKSLLLVGGNISPTDSETGGILIDGMNSRINLNPNGSDIELMPTGAGVLKAQGGAIAIGGLAAPGAIGLNIDISKPDNMSLTFPSGISRVDVSLVNAAALYVAGGGGGSITINARNFNMSGGSVLDAGIVSQLGSSSVLAGNIIIDATNLISLDSSDINDDVSSQGLGNGGNLTITGSTIQVTNGAKLSASTYGQGNAGNLTITALDGISFDGVGSNGNTSGAFSSVQPGAVGNGGNLTITGRTISVTNGAQLNASTLGQGNAGNLTITALDGISFDGVGSNGNTSGAFSSSGTLNLAAEAVGNGGNINITAGNLSISNGAQISTSTFGQGHAGNVIITASDRVSLNGINPLSNNLIAGGIFSAVLPGSVGNGGDINITAGNLSIKDGNLIATPTLGRGNSGNIIITVSDGVSLNGINPNKEFQTLPALGTNLFISLLNRIPNGGVFSAVAPGGVGNGGNINISGRTISVTNGAVLTASTYGQGNSGNLTITALDGISFDGVGSNGNTSGAFSSVQPGAVGNGGNLTITGRTISVTNGAQLNASTLGQGNAGNLTITALDGISFDGVGSNGNTSGAFSSSGTLNLAAEAVGNGGNINITAGNLSISNGAQISTSTFGQGHAGNVIITASDRVSLNGINPLSNNLIAGGIFSTVLPGSVGNGGDINITAGNLSIKDGNLIATPTLGRGNSGNIIITVSDGVSLNGINPNGDNFLFDISTKEFQTLPALGTNSFNSFISLLNTIPNGGVFSAVAPGGVGNGGNINISGRTISVTNGAVLTASTFGQGDAGNIKINVNTFNAASGAGVFTNTATNNRAGDININAASQLTLSDSNTGIFASTNTNSTGKGGNVNIAAPQLTIRNGAQVTAQSQGTGSAGDILKIQANSLTLDNGSITTTSPSGNGGNINNIQVRDLLLLRNNSKISTSAGTQSSGGGNGGNITINAPFIVAPAVENSDIIANAFQGNGGNVQINAQSLFGIESRPTLTPESDINASSQFGQSGIVEINTPTINPAQGLLALPTTVVDASTLIAKNCSEAVGENQFIITGRGGLPPNPDDALSSDTVWEDTHSSATTANQQRIPAATTTKASAATARIISPATGWVFNDKGQVMLVATAPASSFYNPWLNATTCHAE